MRKAKIDLPLCVYLERKTKADRKCIINLNNYRNWHYIINNQVKKKYKEEIEKKLIPLKFHEKIKLTFIYYKGSRRTSDRSNVLSIHEKFFCDALVECGCIEDDRDEYIEETHYYSGGLDKENPRVEAIIETL